MDSICRTVETVCMDGVRTNIENQVNLEEAVAASLCVNQFITAIKALRKLKPRLSLMQAKRLVDAMLVEKDIRVKQQKTPTIKEQIRDVESCIVRPWLDIVGE